MPYLPIIRCGSYTLPPFIAVNKYFTQSGGPDASNTENFQEIQLLLVRLSMVTQKQVQLLQRAAPMKTYGNHNYSKTKPIITLFCNNFTTGKTNSYK
jgi:hypothetical protein